MAKMRKIIIGVMGPGAEASELDQKNAYQLGQAIAREGWVLLTGGRNTGVMNAASQGAKAEQGLVVGVLPHASDRDISDAVDIAIMTGMGSARNNINVLSSDVVIACGMGAGTASEVALALKANKPIVLLTQHLESQLFFKTLSSDNIFLATNPELAISYVKQVLTQR
jgi:uncharacterized protein (TIGR00725 family)